MYRPKGLVNPYAERLETVDKIWGARNLGKNPCHTAFEEGCRAYEEALKAEGQHGNWWHSTGSSVYKMMNVAKTYTHKGTLCFIKDEEKSND